jgi:hypothetical protein
VSKSVFEPPVIVKIMPCVGKASTCCGGSWFCCGGWGGGLALVLSWGLTLFGIGYAICGTGRGHVICETDEG